MAKKNRRSSMRDRVRKRAEQRKSSGGWASKYDVPEETDFLQVKKGTAQLDILPYKVGISNHPEVDEGELWYQRTIWTHFGIGIDELAYICPRTIGKRCPICEEHKRLAKDPDTEKEVLNGLRAKQREIFNVIDLNDEEKGVQLWEYSYHLFGKHLEEDIREGEEDWAGFSELEDGYTLRIRFTEESLGKNTWLEASRIDFRERDENYDESVLDDVFDLDAIMKILSYEELEKIFLGIDDDEEEKPAGFKKTKVKKKKAEPEPESDDDEEDSPKKVTRKKKGTKAKKKEVEPEEDEKPVRKKKGKKKTLECPGNGTFGDDLDELDECVECEVWEDCLKENEK